MNILVFVATEREGVKKSGMTDKLIFFEVLFMSAASGEMGLITHVSFSADAVYVQCWSMDGSA